MVTATPEGSPAPDPRQTWWTKVLPTLLVAAVALVVALLSGRLGAGDDGDTPDLPATAGPATSGASGQSQRPESLEVSSDAPRYRTLESLIAASDLVIEATVVDTAEGRWFGDPADGDASMIMSRLVTLDVGKVLVGRAPQARSVLLEEEGWTASGETLVVDGLSVAEPGSTGIWFLVEGGDAEVGAYVVVGSQGRYLIEGGELNGASGDDPLVRTLSSLSPSELVAAVEASPVGG